MDKLLDNAIQSIEVGIEDFHEGSERRLVSSVRNVYAGLLLLAKTVLWQESPNSDGSLIFIHKKNKDGTFSRTNKTIDVKGIQEAFGDLGIDIDWTPLNAMQSYRNDIEHLFSTADPDGVKEQLGRALPLIETLMKDHLGIDPQSKFSKGCWDALLETKDFFEKVMASCIASFEDIEWDSEDVRFPAGNMRCSCGSYLVAQEDAGQKDHQKMDLVCRKCGAHPDPEDALEAGLAEVTEVDSYIAIKDGGTQPIEMCPECGRDAFIIDIGVCVICNLEIGECAVCGYQIDVVEYNPDYPGFCGSCAHRAAKED